MVRILYLPPFYERKFARALERFTFEKLSNIEYRIFTIDDKYLTGDCNELLLTCRRIIREEEIDMLISESSAGQLLVAKLTEEYPRLCGSGMNLLQTLQCLNRVLMIDLFPNNHCVPTVMIDRNEDWRSNYQAMKLLRSNDKLDGYVKSFVSFTDQMTTSFRFHNWTFYQTMIDLYTNFYEKKHQNNLLSLFRVYFSQEEYPSIFQDGYIIQPFLDLVTYPHWRLVVASACIYNEEILMWPLVDGYCGWPFLAEKPLAILPIILCPSRQITLSQQTLIYNRFREHLNHLISNNHLRYGWIECSYMISSTNEIRLISIKPTYSVYLTEAFSITSRNGNPINALVQLTNHQRPQTPVLNGKTVYIHRLWTNTSDKCCMKDLINIKEMKRIHRSNICLNRQVRLRFDEDEIVQSEHKQLFLEIGFIQTQGEYYEDGLTNLFEFRDCLLKTPERFPFVYHPSQSDNPPPFDPITCLPSKDLLFRLVQIEKQEQKDLI